MTDTNKTEKANTKTPEGRVDISLEESVVIWARKRAKQKLLLEANSEPETNSKPDNKNVIQDSPKPVFV